MNVTQFIQSELAKELDDVNRRIDKLIAQGKFGTKSYKSLCAEHRRILAAIRS